MQKGLLWCVAFVVAACVCTAPAHAVAPLCSGGPPPSGSPVATLTVDVHVNTCLTTCPGPNNCCPAAATLNLPAGLYVATMSGQECSTEPPGTCFADGSGTDSFPGCLPISASGVCAGETNVCILCAAGHPTASPVFLSHLGGEVRVWRNDCFAGDNFGIYTVNFYPADSDGDGVPDAHDACPGTPASEAVNEHGCAIDQLCPCDNPWKNHGQYVSCVAQAAEDFVAAGLITAEEQGAIVSEAAPSFCGK